jgi:hypothetical protein
MESVLGEASCDLEPSELDLALKPLGAATENPPAMAAEGL